MQQYLLMVSAYLYDTDNEVLAEDTPRKNAKSTEAVINTAISAQPLAAAAQQAARQALQSRHRISEDIFYCHSMRTAVAE